MVSRVRHMSVYEILPRDGKSMSESEWQEQALRRGVSPDRDSFRSSVKELFYDKRLVSRQPIHLGHEAQPFGFAFFYRRV